jgi:lactate dehydrogenase-like 2-hydroxyacid dehydrogenase
MNTDLYFIFKFFQNKDLQILEIHYLEKEVKITQDFIERKINDSIFQHFSGPNLKVVSTMSTGYDHLDVPEIKRRGIKVAHTPMVSSPAVAEIAVLLMLSAARRVHEDRIKLDQ